MISLSPNIYYRINRLRSVSRQQYKCQSPKFSQNHLLIMRCAQVMNLKKTAGSLFVGSKRITGDSHAAQISIRKAIFGLSSLPSAKKLLFIDVRN